MNQAAPHRKQTPVASLEERVFVALWRTADALSRAGEDLLKAHDLSSTQYNVLRILRGAGEQGLSCREIGERLVTRDPDITRLLDRLESRALLGRTRETEDRRVVTTRITAEGLRLLAELDEPVQDLHRRQLGHMSQKQLLQLLDLLESARDLVDESKGVNELLKAQPVHGNKPLHKTLKEKRT
jgi:DNA-binding MarR family transcriptional regulator